MTIKERYLWAKDYPSDINEHIPTLFNRALECEHITEFGVRDGVSTSAWLMARPAHLQCYDINPASAVITQIHSLASAAGIRFEFFHQDTSDSTYAINDTDLLFLDTFHTKFQVKMELRNAHRVKRYIILHDTKLFGLIGENQGPGILESIYEFLLISPEWKLDDWFKNNNGLVILKRVRRES